jgi:hypothetical protein
MPITAEEVYLASRVVRATVEVAETLARDVFSHPSRLLNSAETSGTTKALIAVADGAVQAPPIVGERMGTMLTPTRLKEFAEDLFTRAYTKWERDYEFEDKVHESGWDFSRVRSETSRALEQAGIFADLNKPGAAAQITEQLAGKPEAVSAYESFLRTQQEHAEVMSQWNRKVVGPRFRDLYEATNGLAEKSGLFKPRVSIHPLQNALAAYTDGKIAITEPTLTASGRSVVTSMAHEMTHEEQEILQIGLGADQMGIANHASEQQLRALHGWARENGGNLSVDTVIKALKVRDGRFLTDEAAVRALATRDSMQHVLALQKAEAPNAMRVSALNKMESRFIYSDDIKGIFSELAHPNNGFALNEQLFGSARAAEQFRKYSINFGNAISNFDQLPESVQAEYRNDLYGDLRTAIKDMHKITEPFHTAYRASAHETEAFNNADYADSFTAAVNARVRGY